MTTNAFKKSNRFSDLENENSDRVERKRSTVSKDEDNLFKRKTPVTTSTPATAIETKQTVIEYTPYVPISTNFLTAILKKPHEIEEKISENGKPGILTISKNGSTRGPYTDFEKQLLHYDAKLQSPEYVMNTSARDIAKNRLYYIQQYESIHGPDSYEESMISSDFYPPNEPIEHYDFSNDEIYDSDDEYTEVDE